MASKCWCFNCHAWIEKEDYEQSNQDALAAHETSCPANLSKTLFGEHPDLADLERELAGLEKFYGEA